MKIKVPEERSLCQSLRRSGENPLRAGHPDLLAGSGLLREGQILKVADKITVPACLGLRQLLPNPFGAPIHAPELGVGRSMVMHLPSEQPSLRLDICLYGSHPSPSPSTMILSTFASGSSA